MLDASSPAEVLDRMGRAHARERSLLATLTDDLVHGPSLLPGWTRGHLLACRVVFIRAAIRQFENGAAGRVSAFYGDGPDPRAADRAARDAQLAQVVELAPEELVGAVRDATTALETASAAVDAEHWGRPARYRGGGTLLDVLVAGWREAEVHLVDYDLGVRPADWSVELCEHLLDYLTRRVPPGLCLDLSTPEGRTWTLGEGTPVQVRGALGDLAAWLAGRPLDGHLECPSGALPDLGRRNAAQLAG